MDNSSLSSLRSSHSSRRSLHRKTPSLSNYQTTSITKHYQINQQILAAFESNFEQKIYQVAYALGLQFVETALLEIPKHGYYYSRRHERERMTSALDAVRVAGLLQQIQEVENAKLHGDRVERLKDLALEQVEQASNDQTYESHRAETEAELRNLDDEEMVVCEPLLACADSFSSWLQEERYPRVEEKQPEYKALQTQEMESATRSAAISPTATKLLRSQTAPSWQWSSRSLTSESESFHASPPPLQRSSIHEPRSSLQQWQEPPTMHARLTSEEQLAKALFLSGLEVTVPQPDSMAVTGAAAAPVQLSQSSRLALATLSDLYHEDFDSLQKLGRIRISYANTYQGRFPDSTNGCTVIAPLLCIHHLLDKQIPDPGLTDTTIRQVIDVETPAILTELRHELGLSAQAFLIPSDAHDYFINNGQLCQEQFINVVGGNILDDLHLDAFLKILSENGKSLKLAATVFFHEHVVAILQVRRDKDTCWYDVIDSLPLKETVSRVDETMEEFHRRLGLTMSEDAFLPMTARIRCLDEEALIACLRWYACSKFSDENMSYIDCVG